MKAIAITLLIFSTTAFAAPRCAAKLANESFLQSNPQWKLVQLGKEVPLGELTPLERNRLAIWLEATGRLRRGQPLSEYKDRIDNFVTRFRLEGPSENLHYYQIFPADFEAGPILRANPANFVTEVIGENDEGEFFFQTQVPVTAVQQRFVKQLPFDELTLAEQGRILTYLEYRGYIARGQDQYDVIDKESVRITKLRFSRNGKTTRRVYTYYRLFVHSTEIGPVYWNDGKGHHILSGENGDGDFRLFGMQRFDVIQSED